MSNSNMGRLHTCAVIVAAGNSSRMGTDKIFYEVEGRPLIGYTLCAFEQAQTISGVVIVTREDCVEKMWQLSADCGFDKVTAVVCGGANRQESVKKGIEAAGDGQDFFCIHDGARPLISPEQIDRINRRAYECGAVCCGTHVVNTFKMIDRDGYVTQTLDRDRVISVATPQTFAADLYRDALQRCSQKLADFTDDAGLVAQAGYPVCFVACDSDNVKITTPEDLDYFKWAGRKRNLFDKQS